MASISFSLTETWVIDSIIHAATTPYVAARNDDCAECEHFFNTEVATRVGSAFISVFAVADAFVHLLTALYKTAGYALAHFGLLNAADWNGDEIFDHLKKVAFFAALAFAGPVVGFIYPYAFYDYWYPNISQTDFYQLVLRAGNGEADTVWPALKGYFERGSVEDRILFFQVFGADETDSQLKRIRELFNINYYKPVPGTAAPANPGEAGWLTNSELAARMQQQQNPLMAQAQVDVLALIGSQDDLHPHNDARVEQEPVEIDEATAELLRQQGFHVPDGPLVPVQRGQRPQLPALKPNVQNAGMSQGEQIEAIFKRVVCLNRARFFHGTRSEDALRAILQSEIEVRHQGAYRGAFASTRPELGYGPYYIGLTDMIGFLSPPLINMAPQNAGGAGGAGAWCGFSKGIPVIPGITVAYIAYNYGSAAQCEQLEQRVFEWTGHRVPVIPLDTVEQWLNSLKNGNDVIPVWWNI